MSDIYSKSVDWKVCAAKQTFAMCGNRNNNPDWNPVPNPTELRIPNPTHQTTYCIQNSTYAKKENLGNGL